MPEWRITLGSFDVETEDDSYIDAAFAAAEWLEQTDPNLLIYIVRKHGEDRTEEVDLWQVQSVQYHPVRIGDLPDGRQAAWPWVIHDGNGEPHRTKSGRVQRYSTSKAAAAAADRINAGE
ncbi:MAG: hypothetical protein ABWY36_05445 [Leifsonia sp.]